MQGLQSVLYHLVTIGLLWLVVVVVVKIMKSSILKGMDEVDENTKERKEGVKKAASLITIAATAIALIFFVVTVLFLTNPTERSYEEMNTIGTSEVDTEYVEPTKEEIKTSSEELIEMRHEEKKEEATRDTDEAMEDFINRAREQAKEAQEQEEKQKFQ